MDKIEKAFLRKMIEWNEGLLSPATLFNGVGQHSSDKLIHKLITEEYIEEVPHTINEKHYTFYRTTEKTRSIFYPTYKKLWFFIRGDIRIIIISVVTALMTTIITLILQKYIK